MKIKVRSIRIKFSIAIVIALEKFQSRSGKCFAIRNNPATKSYSPRKYLTVTPQISPARNVPPP